MSHHQSTHGPHKPEDDNPNQDDLFTQHDPERSVTDQFLAFHHDNPDFYRSLARLARTYLQATGNNKVSIQRCIEIARWDREVQTKSGEFKVNNNFGAYYARALMLFEPDLEGVFETRRAVEPDRWIAELKAKHDRGTN
jgi:hypothetical protein